VTLAPKGLLIEEQRTNALLQSQFASGWLNNGANTITANSATAPDGTTTAALVSSPDQFAYVYQAVTLVIGQVYTASFFVKNTTGDNAATVSLLFIRSTANNASVSINWSGSTLSSVTLNDGTAADFSSFGNGWYRIRATFTAAETAPRFRIYGGNFFLTTGDILLWGAQLEVGAFATSYIPTTTAAATRAADVAVMQGANFSNWYSQSEGTLYGEASFISASAVQSFIAQAATDSGNYIAMYRDSSTQYLTARVRTGGVDQAFMYPTSTTIAANTPYKQAIAYKANDFATAANGAAPVTDTSGTVPTPITLGIGSATYTSSVQLNGHIRRIAAFPRRLADAELTSITS
jgi:hypothetical protein